MAVISGDQNARAWGSTETVSPRTDGTRLIEWTGERCVPWADNVEVVYEHMHRYRFATSFCRGRRVLDLASGEGYGSAILAEVAAEVVGVELDEATVAHARANHGAANVHFVQGSMLDPTVVEPGTFGAVVCFEALEHVDDHERLLTVIANALVDGGLLVISTPDRAVYSDRDHANNPFHVHELDRAEFADLLARHFENVAMLGQMLATGSIMTALTPDAAARAELISVHGDRDGWPSQPALEPSYLIAIASNAELPPVPVTSTFIDAEMLLARGGSAEISALKESLRLREVHVEELEGTVRTLAARAQSLERDVGLITNSKGWRSVMLFRRTVHAAKRSSLFTRVLQARIRRP